MSRANLPDSSCFNCCGVVYVFSTRAAGHILTIVPEVVGAVVFATALLLAGQFSLPNINIADYSKHVLTATNSTPFPSLFQACKMSGGVYHRGRIV